MDSKESKDTEDQKVIKDLLEIRVIGFVFGSFTFFLQCYLSNPFCTTVVCVSSLPSLLMPMISDCNFSLLFRVLQERKEQLVSADQG